jgi:hypothetical protein
LKTRGKLYTNEAIPVAIRIKAAMEKSMEYAPRQLTKFNNLKSELPRSVQIIVWNKKVQLETKAFPGQYMYAAGDDLARDEDRRNIFVWKAGGFDSQGEWKFSTKNDGETFLIKNTHFNEYLYAAADDLARDTERRNVFTWRPGSYEECDWKVEILGNDEVMLRSHNYHQEYMYAAYIEYDDERRHVFTWRPIEGCDDTCIWKFRLNFN